MQRWPMLLEMLQDNQCFGTDEHEKQVCSKPSDVELDKDHESRIDDKDATDNEDDEEDDDDANDDQGELPQELKCGGDGNCSYYGFMFDVQARQDPVRIHAIKVMCGERCDYTLWEASGKWQEQHRHKDRWTKVKDGSMTDTVMCDLC